MKKFYSLLMAVGITASLFAQPCHKLFFSEYVEGSGNNKALEIYNPTSAPVNLFGYKVVLFINGSSTPNTTFNLNTVIAANDVYVITNNQADTFVRSLADTVSGVCSFNGDDAVALLNGSDTIDVIGFVGNDPGTAWSFGGGSTNNHTLIRKSAVAGGVTPWDTTQWTILGIDTIQLGAHNGPTNLSPCAVVSLDTVAVFSPTAATFTGVNGTHNLNISLNIPHTDSMSIDVKLSSGNAAWINNYTTQTVGFPSGSTNKTLAITITNDTTGGATHVLTFTLVNAKNGLMIGADSVFTLTLQPPVVFVPGDTCGALFFSEYVEGSGNNKALEIYNPTANTINLSGYKVALFINGSTTPGTTFNLHGTLDAGDVYVIASSQANDSIKALADTLSSVTNYNGNDAIALIHGPDTLDVIGIVGVDPGASGWTVGSGTTVNHTLLRTSLVQRGTTNWTNVGVNEWNVLAQDTIRLGSHTGPVNVNACTLSPVSGVNEVANENISRIYPNPNNGTFTIELKEATGNSEVKLYDLAGRMVYYTNESSNLIHINLNQVNTGLYLVEVKTGNITSRSKITIQQ